MRAGEVIAKLAEDAYFMRVDNRVTQPPPVTVLELSYQVAALTSAVTVLELSYQPILTVLAQRPEDHLKVATAPHPQPAIVRSFLTATMAAVAAAVGAPTTELTRGPAAEAIVAAEVTRTATSPEPHRVASMPARRSRNCGGRSPPP
jgi:hypothetical protein